MPVAVQYCRRHLVRYAMPLTRVVEGHRRLVVRIYRQ